MLRQDLQNRSVTGKIIATLLSHNTVITVLSLLLIVQIAQNQMLIRSVRSTAASDNTGLIGSKIELPQLKTVDGKTFSFDRSSKYLVIYFHTDCPYCHRDIALWNVIQAKSREHNTTIIAVTQEDNQAKIAKFVQDSQIAFPVLLDPQQHIISQIKAQGTPTKVLVGAEGQIMQVWRGLTTRASGEAEIGALMIAFGIDPEILPASAELP